MTQAALAGLGLALLLALPVWLASVLRRDASLADRAWPLWIAAPSCLYAWLLGADWRGPAGAMLALLIAWALRLCAYISRRNWGHGEDRRYQAIRARNHSGFAFKSLYLVFGLPAVLAWLVSAPLLAGLAGGADWNALGLLGLAAGVAGLLCEAAADAQMARFRADPALRGQVMDRGLWRYSRHPNYFGEACVWWGLWLMGLGAAGWAAAWSVVSPALITFLLLRVSGVALLEKDLAQRGPAFRAYIARTSAFVPWPPRAPRPVADADADADADA